MTDDPADLACAPGHVPTCDAAVPMQRICGWCRTEIAPGTRPATYTICPRCFVRLERDPNWSGGKGET
jgi:hypothetical protein